MLCATCMKLARKRGLAFQNGEHHQPQQNASEAPGNSGPSSLAHVLMCQCFPILKEIVEVARLMPLEQMSKIVE